MSKYNEERRKKDVEEIFSFNGNLLENKTNRSE